MKVSGIVLCGGQSKRMGQPKAWLPFAGELMLPRVVRLLRTSVEPVVVVAAPEQDLPQLPADILLVRDEEKGRGPLQGLSAGLHALIGRCDAAYASSCDVPFLNPAFVRRMIELLGDHRICVPHVDGFHHPLAAVYRMEVVDTVDRLLGENRLRPVFLFDAVPTRIVAAEELRDVDPELKTLRNLNTPEEYKAALREFDSSK
jgi:molybdenum cofactor guanylyltransferase